MTIKKKTLLLVAVAIAIFEIAFFAVQKFVVLPSYMALERNDAQENVERAVSAIHAEIDHLERLCRDWASWDDSVAFVEGKAPAYEATNLTPTTLANGRLNVVIFLDAHGKTLWSRAWDFEADQRVELAPTFAAALPPAPIKGIRMIDGQPLLLVALPILDSNSRGPSRGTLVFGRFLTDEDVRALNERTQVTFTVFPVARDGRAAEIEDVLTRFERGETNPVREVSRQELNIYAVFRDLSGTPVLMLRTTFPRQIAAEGMATIRLASVFSAVSGLLILLLVVVGLDRMLLRPIFRLTRHSQSIEETGDFSTRIRMKRRDEIGQLAHAFDGMIEKIQTQTAALEALSYRDGLTGVFNRRHFDRHLDQLLAQHRRDKTPLSLIICDIDFFKLFNDTYGHLAGDDCLRRVAQAITEQCRRPIDMVARYGGEEFVVLLPQTERAGAMAVAERIRRGIEDQRIPHTASSVADHVSLSLGVTTVTDEPVDSAALVGAADKALYAAKEGGRNRVIFGDSQG